MFDLDEAKRKNKEQNEKITEYAKSAQIESKKKELVDLEKQTTEPNFWNDPEKSSKVSSRISELKRKVQEFLDVQEKINTVEEMLTLLSEENDEEIASLHKVWLSWGDAFELNIKDGTNEIMALAVVIAIDCVQAMQEETTSISLHSTT